MGRTTTTSAQEAPREESGPQDRPNLRWLQTWLTCVTFYYPAFWLALFLVHALPSLIQVVLFRERLKFLQLSPFIALAVSGPAANLTPARYRQASDPRALLEVVFISIAVAILLAFFGRAHRLQAGLALALLGEVGMVTWPWPLPDNLAVESVVQQVEAAQQRYHRPVIFTEVGFPSLEGANRRPWDDSRCDRISFQAQVDCYQAIFRAFYNQPWFEGMYWWKIETHGRGGTQDGSHTPWGKPAMEVMKHWYSEGGR
jgi:hypothetical protein